MTVECPYCEYECNVEIDDTPPDESTYEMCKECEKSFVFHGEVEVEYFARRADCLNGADHKYKTQRVFPKQFAMMQCQYCEHTRKPTESEMKEIMGAE